MLEISSGVTIDHVLHPEDGCVVVRICGMCRSTDISWEEGRPRPLAGDAWVLTHDCEECIFAMATLASELSSCC